jgi:hypothetical protein
MRGSGPFVGPPESNRSVPALLSIGEPLVDAPEGALAGALALEVLPGDVVSDVLPGTGPPPERPHSVTVTV